MTLCISALTPDGIVLTADSRQTYKNLAQANRIGTDNARKLFQLAKKVGVVIAGRAFALDEKGELKSVGWFIEQFKKNELKKTAGSTIKDLGTNLISYLVGKKVDGVSFIVAGYENDGVGRAYLANVPGTVVDELSRNTSVGGFLRIGQDDVVARIMNGWGGELLELDFVKKAQSEGVNVGEELNKAHYQVNWGTITMQDAIDFSILMTRVTESTQRFSDGTFLHPGGIPGVGGSIDIASINSEEGFTWLKKKELRVND